MRRRFLRSDCLLSLFTLLLLYITAMLTIFNVRDSANFVLSPVENQSNQVVERVFFIRRRIATSVLVHTVPGLLEIDSCSLNLIS